MTSSTDLWFYDHQTSQLDLELNERVMARICMCRQGGICFLYGQPKPSEADCF